MGKTNDVREAVEAELGFDPFIDLTNITVRNINGDVALNGTIPSYPQYLEAAAAARRVTGVTSVHNHLEVVEGQRRHRRSRRVARDQGLIAWRCPAPDFSPAAASRSTAC
jgi:hypothetical protein